MDTEIKSQLEAILAQVKEHKEKAEAEQKSFGTMLEETKIALSNLQKQADALDIKLAERHAAAQPEESLSESMKKNERLQSFMGQKGRKTGSIQFEFDGKQARQIFEQKTTITSDVVGLSTSGVIPIERTPGIVQEARANLTLRAALASRPTTMQVIDFVKVNSPLVRASPQIEAHTKLENAVTFTTASERVQTIATWIPASTQILDDMPELEGYLRAGLPYYVNLAVEQQLLTGSGSNSLHGLITQATSFSTGLLGSAWTRLDMIARVIQQIQTANEVAPSFIVLHPVDAWSIRLTKDTQGRYILGDPQAPLTSIFGLTPIVTTNITSGTFLVGSGSSVASEIRDRMGMVVEIATQHEDYFARNMVAIRAEIRLALLVYRPASYITGTFTSSPA